MSVKITRCPQCQTSFKVSDEHLAIAAGAVRCGSCLHVFQALEHLVPQPPIIDTAASTAAPATVVATATTVAHAAAPAAKKVYEIDGDALISDDMDFEDEEDEPPQAVEASFNSVLELGEDIPDQTFDVPDDLNVELAATDDWQRALNAGSAEAAAAAGDSDDYSDLFDDEDWEATADQNAEDLSLAEMQLDDAADTVAAPAPSTGTDLSELDDFDSDQLLAELQATIADLGETQAQTAQTVAALTDETLLDPAAAGLRFGSEAPEFQSNAAAEPDHFAALANDTPAADTAADSYDHAIEDRAVADLGLNPDELPPVIAHKPLIDQIEPLPVDIGRFEREPTDWLGLLKGIAAGTALMAVFFAQYVFFNFNDLSHDLQARSWLGKICSTGICQLPALDPARVVKISNLIVRSHPTEPNALAIDAILLNVESEPVPVPELELLFSTMEKLPLASRRFKPTEFLAGEMSGQTELPPGRPVHIALAIIEPGPDAVNWTLAVKRAAP